MPVVGASHLFPEIGLGVNPPRGNFGWFDLSYTFVTVHIRFVPRFERAREWLLEQDADDEKMG